MDTEERLINIADYLNNDKVDYKKSIDDRDIHYCGKNYNVCHIKKWLKENEDQYSWIEDYIEKNEKPPITDAKFSRLIYLISNITKEEIFQFKEMGSLIYSMPSYSDIMSKFRRKSEIKRQYDDYNKAVENWCIACNCKYNYGYIIKLVKKAGRFLESIQDVWLMNILNSVKKGEIDKESFEQIILRANYYMKKLKSIEKEINGHVIELPKEMSLKEVYEKFDNIYEEYKKRGKLNIIFKLLHNDCDMVLKKSSVDSKFIETKEQIRVVKLYIEKAIIKENLKILWNTYMKKYGGEEIEEIDLDTVVILEKHVNKIDMIINWDTNIKDKIVRAMKEIVFLDNVDWYNKDTYKKLNYGVLSIKYISEYKNLENYINNIGKFISNFDGFDEVVTAIRENDIVSLKKAYKKIDRVKEAGPYIREIDYLLEKINRYCPKSIEKLINEEDRLNMLVKYKNFSMAWSWKQLNIMVKETRQNMGLVIGMKG